MTENDGITLRVISGRTALGRRLSMVAGVDIVVTISGKKHTEVVVEQALELGVPVLPIPDFHGDSEKLLRDYRDRLAAAFNPGALTRCLNGLSQYAKAAPTSAADSVVELVRNARIGKCLVLLPYDPYHKALYTSVIEPAVLKHMIPIRLDEIPRSDAIYSSFGDAIRSSSAVIADITLINENVMYEIGYAHGCGQAPLIYCRDSSRLDRLPVYLRTLNVRVAGLDMDLERLIDDYLQSFSAAAKARRRSVG